MRTKNDHSLRTLGKEFILVADGVDSVDLGCMVSMNESAAFLWKAVEGKDFDADTLVDLLTEEYDVTREVAEKDVAALLQTWKDAGAIN